MNKKEKMTDIKISYLSAYTSTSTNVSGDFDEIVLQISKAKKKGDFFILNGFAINPHYILTIKDITQDRRRSERRERNE